MKTLVIWTALLATSSIARADDRAKAETYFRAGEQAFRQQSFAAAAESFELAYKQSPLPEIAFSAAQAYRRQYFIEPKPQYCKRAVELYRVYLDNHKTGGRVGDAADGLAEMQRELDRLGGGAQVAMPKQNATRVMVSVTVGEQKTSLTAMAELSAMPASDATGATAKLDGNSVELYVPVNVEPGDHTVEVTANGYLPVSETRKVIPGETEPFEIRLVAKPARITFAVEPGATIAIDGRPLGETPLAAQDLPAGDHLLAVTRRGREPVAKSVTLVRGETRTIEVALHHTGKRQAVPWLVGAGGVLALGSAASAVIAVLADNKMASIEATREKTGISQAQFADYKSDTSRRDSFRDTAWIAGGAAVAVAAAAVALYYFDTPSLPTERTVVPVVTPNAAGVAVVGRF